MITKRSATAARLPIRRAGAVTAGRAAAATVGRVVPRSVLSRATDAVANRLDRRSFIARSALVGSALVTAPADLLLRPTSAYAAVCSCQGQSCTCGSLCCDGYTEFCCAIYGANACPSGLADRRLVEGRRLAASAAARPGTTWTATSPAAACGCGGGRASAAARCNGTAVRLRQGPLRPPQGGLHVVPLRQLQQQHRLHRPDPVPGRHLHRTVADRADAARAAPCAPTTTPEPQPPLPPGRPRRSTRWPATGTATASTGIGFYDNRNGALDPPADGHDRHPVPTFTYGRQPGDRPVVGDWNGDGVDTHRRSSARAASGTSATATAAPRDPPSAPTYGVQAGDIPVVGDWNGDGIDSIGIFRRRPAGTSATASTHAADRRHVVRATACSPATSPSWATGTATASTASASSARARGTCTNSLVAGGDLDRIDRLRRSRATSRSSATGTASGGDSIGVYRPSEGKWYLRRSLTDGSTHPVVTFGPAVAAEVSRDGRHRRRPRRWSWPCSGCWWSACCARTPRSSRPSTTSGVNLEDGAPAPTGAALAASSPGADAHRRRACPGRAARTLRSAPPPTSTGALPTRRRRPRRRRRRRAQHAPRVPLHRVRHLRHVLGRARRQATRRSPAPPPAS